MNTDRWEAMRTTRVPSPGDSGFVFPLIPTDKSVGYYLSSLAGLWRRGQGNTRRQGTLTESFTGAATYCFHRSSFSWFLQSFTVSSVCSVFHPF